MSTPKDVKDNAIDHPALVHCLLPLLAVCSLAFTLYSFSMLGPPIFDDYGVFAGHSLSSMLGRCSVPRRVVANLTFAGSFYLHGDRVLGYHLVNVLCHIATALGVFYLILALPIAAERRERIAWLSSLIFVAHPLATQGVSFMAQRYSCMSAAFAIWALVSYCRMRAGEARYWCVLVFVFPILAVLTKEYVVVLPALALTLELLFFRSDERRRLLLGMGAMILSVAVLGWSLFASRPKVAEVASVPAAKVPTVTDWTFGRVPRGVYARSQLVIVPGKYVRLAFVPIGQSLDHAFTVYESWDLPVLAGAAVLLLLLLSPILLRRKAPLAGFGLLLLVLPILPPSSLVPNTEFVAEHRAYLGVSGFAMAAGCVIAMLPWRAMLGVAIIYVCVLGGLTINRNLLWNDSLALWADAAYKAQDRIPRPWCGVGIEHFKNKDYSAAEAAFRKSLSISAKYMPARLHLAMSLEQQDKLKEAIIGYSSLVAEHPDRPDLIAHAARVLLKLGEVPKATAVAQQALKLQSSNTDALLTLGQAFEKAGEKSEAVKVYERLLQLGLQPDQRQAVQGMLKRVQQ